MSIATNSMIELASFQWRSALALPGSSVGIDSALESVSAGVDIPFETLEICADFSCSLTTDFGILFESFQDDAFEFRRNGGV